MVNNDASGVSITESEGPEEKKPSANSSICLNFIGDDGFDDYQDIVTANFEGETEAEVKLMVEEWAANTFQSLVDHIKKWEPPK